jgi:hypothetical protein
MFDSVHSKPAAQVAKVMPQFEWLEEEDVSVPEFVTLPIPVEK